MAAKNTSIIEKYKANPNCNKWMAGVQQVSDLTNLLWKTLDAGQKHKC